MSARRPAWGWAVVTAATGTVLIGVGAFWLSFMALADLAARSGIAPGQAWIWPLLMDGLIVVSTIAVVALDGRRGAWYPWALLICGALVSVAANALHSVVAADASVPAVLAATVGGGATAGAAGQHPPDRGAHLLDHHAPQVRRKSRHRRSRWAWSSLSRMRCRGGVIEPAGCGRPAGRTRPSPTSSAYTPRR